jgi:hypothetical protein
MYFLGNANHGYQATDADFVLSDGRVIGPFESTRARSQFAWWFADKAQNLVSARELFEGSVSGDEIRLVKTDEFALETHPFKTVYDTWIEPDNGSVVLEMPVEQKVVEPSRVIYLDAIQRHEPTRRLEAAKPTPDWIDLEYKGQVNHVEQSAHRGQLVVAEVSDRSGQYFDVGWRKDARVTKSIVCLSRHTLLRTAINRAAELAQDYIPAQRHRPNRPRDAQKDRLYAWECSVRMDFQELPSIVDAQLLADQICDDLQVKRISVRLGPPSLTTQSYYRGDGIALSATMVTNHTVVHEVAHHVSSQLGYRTEASHGPHFAGILLALMVGYLEADKEEALESAANREVVINRDTCQKVEERLALSQSAVPGI